MDTTIICDICENCGPVDEDSVCSECAKLEPWQRREIMRRATALHVAKMRSMGRVSLFESLAPRKEDFR